MRHRRELANPVDEGAARAGVAEEEAVPRPRVPARRASDERAHDAPARIVLTRRW